MYMYVFSTFAMVTLLRSGVIGKARASSVASTSGLNCERYGAVSIIIILGCKLCEYDGTT